jgi:hypothetical protein
MNLNSAIHSTTDNTDTTDGRVYENKALFFFHPQGEWGIFPKLLKIRVIRGSNSFF